MAMTSLHQQRKQQRWLLLSPLCSKAALPSPSPFLVVGVVVVVVVMLKSLHLVVISTLTSTF